MKTARVMQSDWVKNNHHTNKLVEQASEIIKLSMVQGMLAKKNPDEYKLPLQGRNATKSETALFGAKLIDRLDETKVEQVETALRSDRSITSAIRSRGLNMSSKESVTDQSIKKDSLILWKKHSQIRLK